MSEPVFSEDSNSMSLSPNLAKIVQKLDENSDKYDYLVAFLITIMAESGYRVSCLFDKKTNTWSREMLAFPEGWRNSDRNFFEIDFIFHRRTEIGCKLILIPIGDWLILNLMAKGASSNCKTRCMSVNVVKYINMYQKELGRYWHLKELAINFKNFLLAPLHGEIMMEVGIASPSLEGLPQEIKVLIASMLDVKSRKNLEKACHGFNSQQEDNVVSL